MATLKQEQSVQPASRGRRLREAGMMASRTAEPDGPDVQTGARAGGDAAPMPNGDPPALILWGSED